MMPERKFNQSSKNYRFGFNGFEKDDEVKGDGNHISFSDYGYDPRIGRRWNVDPLTHKFPYVTPYNFVENNSTNMIDPDGRSGEPVIDKKNKIITINSTYVFYGSKATAKLAAATANEISWQNNNYGGKINYKGEKYKVKFNVYYRVVSESDEKTMAKDNKKARFNFIRVEDTNVESRSFVTNNGTGKGSNSGHWITTDNLGTSTTASA